MTFTVLATDRVSKKGLEPLTGDPRFEVLRIHDSTSAEFTETLRFAEALIVRSATTVDAGLLDGAGRLRAIGRAGVGIDNIDVETATGRGIAVYNAPAGNTTAAAELTMALMLSLVRRVTQADRSIRDGNWDRAAFRGAELKGKTLGLIGAGRIGGEVAKRCHAFGMDVLVFDPYLDQERADALDVALTSLSDLLSNSDIVSIHVPFNDETRGLLGSDEFTLMSSESFVINVSRGGVVDEVALVDALGVGEIAGAALDVFEVEPLPPDSPLRTAPNLLLTPHLGASTSEAQIGVAAEVAGCIKAWLVDHEVGPAVNAAELSV